MTEMIVARTLRWGLTATALLTLTACGGGFF